MAMTTMRDVQPYVDSMPLLTDPQALRQRARQDGCLFFRGLLPQDDVLDVRRQVLDVCARHDWLAEGSDLIEGIVHADRAVIESRDPRWQAFYCDVLKLRAFHALALNRAIIDALGVLFGEAVLPHSRNICRAMFPQTQTHSTPPHQDHFYIGGSDETWTAWIPLGDCPAELGSLAVACGMHEAGFIRDVHEAQGAGGSAVDVGEETAWFGGDFQCGDVLFVHSLAVHQGRDNETEDRLRLSVDYRYQPQSHPVRADSLLPHMGWQDWEDIYADWDADDPLRYYWQAWDLNVRES